MFAIEMKTTIDHAGNVHVPEHYRQFYGRAARLFLLVPDESETRSATPGTSIRGALRGKLSSVDDFIAAKQGEMVLEECR